MRLDFSSAVLSWARRLKYEILCLTEHDLLTELHGVIIPMLEQLQDQVGLNGGARASQGLITFWQSAGPGAPDTERFSRGLGLLLRR